MATSVSPGMGTHRHQWVAPKKKEAGSNEVKKFLLEQFPAMKISDIETLANFVTKKDIKEYQREHGHADKD
jgi:hypothetical protein